MISKQAGNYFKTKVFEKSSDRLIKMTVSGNSMWPFLRHGQEISVRKISRNDDVRIGDIVVIGVRNFFLIHRILFKRKMKNRRSWEYFTKGDRRLVADGWIEENNIYGIVKVGARNNVLSFFAIVYSTGLFFLGKILGRK